MLDESRTEFMLRWHFYRRWKRVPKRHRVAEFKFYKLMDSLPRDGLFVDLGANIGNVTAAALAYGHRVVAYEPDPLAAGKLQQRFAANPRVEIVQKAVGAEARVATLFRKFDVEDRHATELSSLIEMLPHANGKNVEVEVVSVVDVLRALPQFPVVVKMDIEGAEIECLEAILDAGLHRSVGAMLVESHDWFSPEIGRRLEAIKARIEAESIKNIDMDWG